MQLRIEMKHKIIEVNKTIFFWKLVDREASYFLKD